jgi:ketosteroid isomerase-like protein
MRSASEDEIWRAIAEANRAWLGGHPENVGPLFHERAVMFGPAFATRIEGRTAITQGFVDYTRYAKTHLFEERDRAVDIFGDTAVVTYAFFVRYEAEGQVHDETGREILTLMREDGRWQVVWRTQLSG